VRPNVPELVRGITAALLLDVTPELRTAWAQAEVRYALGVLDTVALEWDAAADNLVRENGDLQRCATFAAALADEYRGALPVPLVAGLLDAAGLPPVRDLKLSTLTKRNEALWQAVIPLIECIAAEAVAPEHAGALRSELSAVLHRYVAARRLHRGV
jgi:hypothetical protein